MAAIYVETWRTTYAGMVPDKVLLEMSPSIQAARWARSIARGDELVMLAENEAKGIVALSSGGRARGESGCGAEIFTLYVLPDEQGSGVGRTLLAGMFAEFLAQSLDSAIIWVLAANPARFFYETTGGMRFAEREERLWGSDLLEIAYIWPDLSAVLETDLKIRR
ncbi:MAG: GNAT family N-acetyltransferase [Alphaproteobacteria bacterium]